MKLDLELPHLDLFAHMPLSAWRLRHWTHQVLTLTHRPLLQLVAPTAVPFYGLGSDTGPMTTFTKNQSVIARTLAANVLKELNEVSGRWRAGTVDVRRPSIIVSWFWKTIRGPIANNDFRVQYFRMVWYSFLGKTSSKPEDMQGIFANLLPLSVAELLQLPPKDRMKANLASFEQLSIELLLDSYSIARDEVDGSQSKRLMPAVSDGYRHFPEREASCSRRTPRFLLLRWVYVSAASAWIFSTAS